MTKIEIVSEKPVGKTMVFLVSSIKDLPTDRYSKAEIKYLVDYFKSSSKDVFTFCHQFTVDVIVVLPKTKMFYEIKETIRRLGSKVSDLAESNMIEDFFVSCSSGVSSQNLILFLEGVLLGSYCFAKYKTSCKQYKLRTVYVENVDSEFQHNICELVNVCEAVEMSRDMINEPVSVLNTTALAKQIKTMFFNTDVKIDILDKTKIKSLKMGGLLGVNRGSKDDPVFCIMEYKPQGAKNSDPIVFVGKGITYDTGGMNLKPGTSMADMKSDMSGGAAVVGAMYAIAKNKLPIYVVGLVPATDNRIGEDAYVPGDILTMSNGRTVEIQNTDAEGRLILADALAYAQKYDPMVVVDIATLTGAAHIAIGSNAIVGMHSKAEKKFKQLQQVGNEVFERIVEFPFWDEYAEQLKSDVADITNTGGRYAGAITAGKFLENFTDYPYIHLDIAGPAFLESAKNYLPKGGTGVGVRLFYEYVKELL